MSGGSAAEDAGRGYRARLEALGLRDVRPLYRDLLKRLREEDPSAYEEAVRRYEEEVDDAVDAADDPVAPWLRYGAWLAERLAPGRAAAVDASGRARDVEMGPGDEADAAAAAAEQLDIAAPPRREGGAGGTGTAGGSGGAGRKGGRGPAPRGGGSGDDAPRGSRDPGEGPVPPGALLLHLPDDDREPALVLALPSEPTEHQEATRELLCG